MLLIFFSFFLKEPTQLLNGPFGENVSFTPNYLFYILQMNLTVYYCGNFKQDN